MSDNISLDPHEDMIFNRDISDDALEWLALTVMEITNYPTLPDAIICVPFERP